jgi:tRNA(Ile)-lysidine synthase TilS/MesJ
MHLCNKHLIDDVTRKAKRDLRKYNLSPGTIAVALSGGKDSSALLHLLHTILAPNRKIKIVAITVDEGISGYREKTIKNASSLTDNLGVEHIVVSFKESFGRTLDNLLETTTHPPCSICGALRKNLLNRTAKELGASYLAIGHNLDDEAQTILINHLRGDISRLVRLSHARVQPGLVPRIKPLRHVPESEVAAYAGAVGLAVCPKACPYMNEAYRLGVRVFLREFEAAHPGTRHGIGHQARDRTRV